MDLTSKSAISDLVSGVEVKTAVEAELVAA